MTKPGWGSPPNDKDERPGGQAGASPHAYRDATRGPRLHKVLADAGVGSRRACEAMIADGAVAVNGVVITELPAWVDPVRDRITVNETRIRRPAASVYILLNKPRGVICTNAETPGYRRAIDLVEHAERFRLFTVGRLDADSTGLILLTNDGDFANRLTHPRYGVHKQYEVTVDGSLEEEDVRRLSAGIFLPSRARGRPKRSRPAAGRPTVRSRLKLLKRGRDRTKLLLELREGRNRQIRRMMLRVGHPVRKLCRVKLGPLKLEGLRPGQWRELQPREVEALRRASERVTKARSK